MKKTLQTTISLSFILGSLAMAADTDTTSELESRHWQLVQYLNTAGETETLSDASLIDIRMSGGEFNGTAGCNNYFGNYQTEGEKLSFTGPIGTTMKNCPEPVMEREYAYLTQMSQVHSYHIDNDTLVLLNKEQQPVLKYRIQQPAELEKTLWQATAINNGRGGVVSGAGTELTSAQFLDGKLTGNAGCNQYSAGYTRDENRITIGPVMTTRKHCPEPEEIMQQEQQYLDAITGTRMLNLDTGTLELRNEDGALQVRFSIKPAAEILDEDPR